MSSKSRDRNTYSKQYPEIKRWLNQCVICESVGFKPELPEKIYPGEMANNIRKLFAPLAVNELNMCKQCARHWTKEH